MKQYVAGFYFYRHTNEVVLVRKARPEWQKGKLNGVGGHIEPSDTDPHAAMMREFVEETGKVVGSWEHFVTLRGRGWVVYFFRADGPWFKPKGAPDEPVEWYVADTRDTLHEVLPNLRWLLPLARDTSGVRFPLEVHDDSH